MNVPFVIAPKPKQFCAPIGSSSALARAALRPSLRSRLRRR
ncbi:MAG: hypothetical protein WCT14_02850 [Treponemataceae bacterium]